MREQHMATKVSAGFAAAAVLMVIAYFLLIPREGPITDARGLLILTPPLFGVPGMVTAIQGQHRRKSALATGLIVLHLLFICWIPILWVGGTMLFGP